MVINCIFHIYTSIANILVIIYFFSNQPIKYFFNISRTITLSFFILGEIFSNLFSNNLAPLLTLVCSISTSVYIAYSCKYTIKQILFWTTILQTIGLLLESSLKLTISPFVSNIYSIKNTFIFINILIISSIIITFLLKQLFIESKNNIINYIDKTDWLIKLSLIPLITLILLLNQLIGNMNTSLNILLITLGFITINILSLYIYTYINNQHLKFYNIHINNLNFQSELNKLKKSKETEELIRSLKHDLKNHHLVLLGLLEQKKYTEAAMLINQNLELISTKKDFFTNDSILNFLLNQKKKEAQKLDIKLEIHCLIPQNLSLKADIISIILGNLLDNSISACSRIANPKFRIINLEIKFFKGNLYIDIENFFEKEEISSRIHRQFNGFGIRNIKRIVSNFHGLYNQEIFENIYKVHIIFPNIFLQNTQAIFNSDN